jgi:hypothetical protein
LWGREREEKLHSLRKGERKRDNILPPFISSLALENEWISLLYPFDVSSSSFI